MPPAVGPAIAGLAGGAGSAAGGKKGSSAASKAAQMQYDIQKQQLALGQGLINTGMQAWQPAKDYWSSLLSGDPNKMAQAVGPSSDALKQTQAAQQASLAQLPQGGEKNLAIAQSQNQGYSDLARLYAGVQPTAANALGQLAGLPTQAGVATQGQAAPNVGAGLKYDTHASEQKGQGAGTAGAGLGSLLYNSIHKPKTSGAPSSTGIGVYN